MTTVVRRLGLLASWLLFGVVACGGSTAEVRPAGDGGNSSADGGDAGVCPAGTYVGGPECVGGHFQPSCCPDGAHCSPPGGFCDLGGGLCEGCPAAGCGACPVLSGNPDAGGLSHGASCDPTHDLCAAGLACCYPGRPITGVTPICTAPGEVCNPP